MRKPVKKAAAKAKKSTKKPLFGKVIVRCRDAGVHFGTYVSHSGREVVLKDARRMWYWRAASGISLSACADVGISSDSKIANVVSRVALLDACEIIPCTATAAASIEGAPCASAR